MRIRHAGLEPATFGSVNRCSDSETTIKQGVSGTKKSGTASTPDNLGQTTPLNPDLQAIIEAWPSLSEPLRAAVLAIVRSGG